MAFILLGLGFAIWLAFMSMVERRRSVPEPVDPVRAALPKSVHGGYDTVRAGIGNAKSTLDDLADRAVRAWVGLKFWTKVAGGLAVVIVIVLLILWLSQACRNFGICH